ncbi:DUF1232 domain-containing protein [Chakrabartia godavariana]|nr:DUF1232 domain-containing protein [Chakrabartia godavariana]
MKSLRDIAHDIRIEAHTIWLCARDPGVPLPARLFGLIVAAYALSPIDLIPDFIPVLGLLDDAILIPLGVWLFLKMVPADVYARERAVAEEASHRPVSRIAAAVIALLWLGALVWAGTLIWTMRFY